ncbi:MAG TPA: hypothetical protein DC064_11800, partial [Cyanobacteria bacterium UBA9273]|nr:hypothetical protein [Cyanobacteria bacterium UBA9273]
PKRFWDELICILALFVLLIPLTIQSLLPQIGDYYKRLGDIAYCKVQVPSAEQAKELAQCQVQLATVEDHYSRASKIDPNDSEAHYKLGFFYEDLQEFERAISEYQIAVKGRIEGESYKAYSRLARLYILHGTKQDYSKAISLLNRALSLELIKKDKETTYAIHTYFGWTRLAQGRPIEASNLLQDAIKLFPNKAAAHCLLAQALDQQNDRKGATTQWEQCLSYANQKDPDEDAWIGLAVQRLKARGGGG